MSQADAKFKGLAKKHGGKMQGLRWHLKDKHSMTRKIVTESINHSWGPETVVIKDLKDALRYTMIFDEAVYSKKTLSVLNDLLDDGWVRLQVKNTWHKKSSYKGVNTALMNPQGQYMELQFLYVDLL